MRLSELAQAVGARVVGDGTIDIDAVATLQEARVGQISFFTNSRYRKQLAETKASAVILRESDLEQCPCAALVSDNPYATYARISQYFATEPTPEAGIHPTAVIADGCRIGEHVSIGANVVVEADVELGDGVVIGSGCHIGAGSRIGERSRLFPHVSIYHNCKIGKQVRIHSGVVIGSDGFGFAFDSGSWIKIEQIGGVVIGDDVEIGANTTIDSGAIEPTRIGNGVKLDNQIQIAHNVTIGEHSVIAGCVGIAGSTHIGKACAIGGGAGILGHLQIADGVTVTATSLVTKSISEAGVYSSGTPLQPSDQWQKNFARFKQLDAMARRIRALEQQLSTSKKG